MVYGGGGVVKWLRYGRPVRMKNRTLNRTEPVRTGRSRHIQMYFLHAYYGIYMGTVCTQYSCVSGGLGGTDYCTALAATLRVRQSYDDNEI